VTRTSQEESVSEPQAAPSEGPTDEVRVPTGAQLNWVAEQLRVLADDVADMAGEGDSPARAVAADLAGSGRRIADYLTGREPAEVLADVRDFARRRPAEFLASALAVGFVMGQFDPGERPKHAAPEPAAAAEEEPTRLERPEPAAPVKPADPDATVPVSAAPVEAQPPAGAPRSAKKDPWTSPPLLLSEPMSPSPYASETYYDDDPPAR
jgi:hypothetical protein